jgi:hypothetical protein
VEKMPHAKNTQKVSEHQIVFVLKAILGIHSYLVTQNVLKITTVHQIEYARIKSVLTPVQDFVVLMLFAQFQITSQVVIVSKVTRVTQQCLAN